MTLQAAHLLGVEHGEGVWSILTSGPHLLAELVLMAVVDGLIGALLWPAYLRWHRRHDAETHASGLDHKHAGTAQDISHVLQRIEALEARASFNTQEDL